MDTELETLLGEQLRKTLRHMVSCARKLSQELHKGINFRKDDPSHKILTASIDLFLWFFVGFGEIWPTLFLNEKIYSTSKTVELGKHIHAFRAEMEEKGAKIPYFAELSALASREIIELIYLSSKNLVADFKKSKDILEKKVSEINSWAQQVDYANKYIIFKVLKELSGQCNSKIREIFINNSLDRIHPSLVEDFVKFVIEKHEVIDITMDLKVEDCLVHLEPQTEEQFHVKLTARLQDINKDMKKFIHYSAEREDGKRALLVVVEGDDQNHEKYLLMKDEAGRMVALNCILLCKKWRSETNNINFDNISIKAKSDIEELIKDKDEILNAMRTAPTSITNSLTEGIETVGGSLGKCLSDFRNYDSVESFVKDFSKKTAMSGSISYIILKMPVVGKLLIVGGFSFSLYKIITNDFKSRSHKLKDTGKIAIKTTTNLGGGVMGAVIGQALIPIPYLGLFVGGMVGGFLANLGSKKIMNYIKKQKFQQIASRLSTSIHPKGFWKYSAEMLNTFGLKEKYFQKTIPPQFKEQDNGEDIWVTAICFCILSYFESKKDEEKMIEDQKAKTHLENKMLGESEEFAPGCDNLGTRPRQLSRHEFINSDLERCIEYLQHQNFSVKDNLNSLTDLMIKILED